MAKKVKNKKAKVPKSPKTPFIIARKYKIVFGCFLAFFGIALLIAFTSFFFNWQADQSTLSQLGEREVTAQNLLNKFGAGISNFFVYKGFGIASFIFAILVTITGIYLFFNLHKKALRRFWFWGILVMIWLSVFFGFFAGTNPMLGGTVGFEINDFLQDYLGLAGTILLMAFLFIVYLVIRFKITPEKLSVYFKSTKKDISEEFKTSPPSSSISVEENPEEKPVRPFVPKEDTSVKNAPLPESEMERLIIKSEENPDDMEMEVSTAVEEEMEDGISRKLVNDFGEFDPTLELKKYKFPTLELLKDYSAGSGGITINQEELEENKNKIVDTLKNYKIEIAQIKATVGPTVTLYEIIPEAGIRISKIKNLEDDIALSLSALGIRIIAPIPGKGTIGIEVPNKKPTVVSMRSVIASPRFQKAEMELPLALGKTISNETFVVDLAKMPHLLMAGATGQGKSVGLNAILTSLLYSKHPAEVKFILVDPKKVELTLFNKIERHYLAKLPNTEEAIITDNTKVIHTLNSLCIEMDNRYELLKDAMVRNIKEYNTKFKARRLNPEEGHKFLPYIVL
ncbi:MAG TPA: DNA translocase FtsK 4TM domain-containing protein, partial [Salinimicrobium sp.]|nr:DNA translocase FtsK 4TM domain-containing protein [Salinimicrobium sp.]